MHYVVTSTLPAEFAGRTKALLKRTRLLSEQGQLPIAIISTNYNPNYKGVYRLYYKNGYIPKQVKLMNIYDFLSKRTYEVPEIEHPPEEKGLIRYELEKNKIYRFFDNGKYVLYKNYESPGNRLKFIDIMDPHHRIRKIRKEYNLAGLCHKEIIYKQGTTYILEEIFLDESGKAYLNKTYNGTAEQKLIRIYLFQEGEAFEFKTEKEWIRHCFEQMIEKHSTVICDARFLDRPLLEMNVPKVKKILLFHNSHLNSNDVADVKSSYRYALEHLDDLDEIVVLTNKQQVDLAEVVPDTQKVKVIPHSVELKNLSFSSKRADKLVFIGRLDEQKQVHHLIEAYRLKRDVLRAYPLEIYGDGDYMEQLQQQINDAGLQEQVKLRGKTATPEKIFAQAKASFLTSRFEGFGLVMIESLNNGCPVVAYDIKYGPSDLIVSGQNGLLVPPDDIAALSEAMAKAVEMEFPNVRPADQFSDEQFLENWLSLLKEPKPASPFSKFFKRA